MVHMLHAWGEKFNAFGVFQCLSHLFTNNAHYSPMR